MSGVGVSRFEGGVLPYIGFILLFIVLGFMTFGLAVPWIQAYFQRWICANTIIDGRRLTFDGSGTQLFGNYIKRWLFSVITFGIYALWLFNKMTAWTVKHTHFAE